METKTRTNTACVAMPGSIGPVGVAARIAVGLVFVAAALWWRDPTWADVESRIAELAETRRHLQALAGRAAAQDPADCRGYCAIITG